MRMSISILFAALGSVSIMGCGDGHGKEVHLVVPAGFEGTVQVIADNKNGAGYQVANGRIEITVPADGIVHVKSLGMFEHWHTMSGADSARSAINWVDPALAKPGDRIVQELGSRVSNQSPPTEWLAVGSPSYVRKAADWFNNQKGEAPPASTRPTK